MEKSFVPIKGLDFIEFAAPDPAGSAALAAQTATSPQASPAGSAEAAADARADPAGAAFLAGLFRRLGFMKTGRHKTKPVQMFEQGSCRFVINQEKDSFAEDFAEAHGPSVCALGFSVSNSRKAFLQAAALGAEPVPKDPSHSFPAIYGVGGSLIYFTEEGEVNSRFHAANPPPQNPFLLSVDHLTHNVRTGRLNDWREFYSKIFGFVETRHFDIKGVKTGLVSKVMSSPEGSVVIPVNEPSPDEFGKKSQIQEFLDQYKGEGVQHIALKTETIIEAVQSVAGKGVEFLDIPDSYYDNLTQRVPLIKEDIADLKKNQILGDGDSEGYLLQIFTKNIIGPIFFEMIQRRNHSGFGEGNFQALFDAIERDQVKRGYLK